MLHAIQCHLELTFETWDEENSRFFLSAGPIGVGSERRGAGVGRHDASARVRARQLEGDAARVPARGPRQQRPRGHPTIPRRPQTAHARPQRGGVLLHSVRTRRRIVRLRAVQRVHQTVFTLEAESPDRSRTGADPRESVRVYRSSRAWKIVTSGGSL